MEYDEIEDGMLWSRVGACCDSCRATAGERCAGGWRREDDIMAMWI